jgi:hypothetical protein
MCGHHIQPHSSKVTRVDAKETCPVHSSAAESAEINTAMAYILHNNNAWVLDACGSMACSMSNRLANVTVWIACKSANLMVTDE